MSKSSMYVLKDIDVFVGGFILEESTVCTVKESSVDTVILKWVNKKGSIIEATQDIKDFEFMVENDILIQLPNDIKSIRPLYSNGELVKSSLTDKIYILSSTGKLSAEKGVFIYECISISDGIILGKPTKEHLEESSIIPCPFDASICAHNNTYNISVYEK